jgi:hypothetical protein
MAGKWKEYRKKRAEAKARTLEFKKAADKAGWTGPVPKRFRKSGGKIVQRQTAGTIGRAVVKPRLEKVALERAAMKKATASSVSKVQQDGIIRRFARDNGKAAAIKRFGADRVAKVSMPTKRIGKPPTRPRHGEGGFGISGSSQTRQPRLLPDDSWVVRGGTAGGRKSGGKITYKMTGGQVVAHGYD